MALLPCLQGYRILFLAPFRGPSHLMFLEHFVTELDRRGHSVTYATAAPVKQKLSANYTEVLIDPPLDVSLLGELSEMPV